MRYALCNEMFGDEPFDQVFPDVREMGYTGIEFAPFTLLPDAETVDVRDISAERRQEVRRQAEEAGLEVVGLHWLLAKTLGFYLTSPNDNVRRETTEYFKALAQLCSDLGGTIMVLGSPQQRNLLPGVSYVQAEAYAAEVLRGAMPVCEDLGVTIALEPLAPTEGDFLLTASQAISLMKMVDSPSCRLHLDVKAMSSEKAPIQAIIIEHQEHLVHFHANDPNLLGPGMGEVGFGPIFGALRQIDYQGWVSVEVFKYEPSPREIARESIEYMQRI